MAPATRVAVIGARLAVEGFGLAGALVRGADSAEEVLRAWTELADSVAVVVLTRSAAQTLGDTAVTDDPLVVVLP